MDRSAKGNEFEITWIHYEPLQFLDQDQAQAPIFRVSNVDHLLVPSIMNRAQTTNTTTTKKDVVANVDSIESSNVDSIASSEEDEDEASELSLFDVADTTNRTTQMTKRSFSERFSTSYQRETLRIFKSIDDKLGLQLKVRTIEENDDVVLFCKSLVPSLKRVRHLPRLRLKCEIMKAIANCISDPTNIRQTDN